MIQKREFEKILKKGGDPKEIRDFFRTYKNIRDLSRKVVIWGHHFLPRYFSKATPKFHYELVEIFFRHQNDYTAAPRGYAKALSIETPILTTNGFKRLENVVVGDFVFGEDGKPARVSYKSPIYKNRECYEVIFSDGSSIIADADHDWMVEDKALRCRITYKGRTGLPAGFRVKDFSLKKMTTEEIKNDLYTIGGTGRKEVKHSIPVTKPLEFPEKELPVPPYFLGQWLGDGHNSRSAITTEDSETVNYLYKFAESLGLKVTVYDTNNKSKTYYLSNKETKKENILNTKLRSLNVIKNKHIPDLYKFSSYEQRLELLKGLMDSDGTISKTGHCSFSGINKRLVEDVLYLVHSLGIKAVLYEEDAKLYGRFISKTYRIGFTTEMSVFSLKRKRERERNNKYLRNTRRFIVDVKSIETVPVQCLKVENESSLFLAGINLIPTHNTTVMQLCMSFSGANGLDEFIVLVEKTFTEASEVLEAIREEFKTNDEILRVYGDLTKVNSAGKDQDNLRDAIGDFFIGGVRLRAKGFDSPIRGLKSKHSRPTRIVLDDCESDEHIDNVEQRKKYLDYYVKGIVPAVDNETGVIKMFGTILHDDSLLNTLIKSHNGKIYRAWDEEKRLLWASNWTVDKLERKRDEMRIGGKGDASFYQEYFNQPLDEEAQLFKREMFQYFNNLYVQDTLLKKNNRIYTLVDPAISKKTTADFTAIVTLLVDDLNRLYILQITRERMNPLETIKAIFAHYERWRPLYVGIEAVSYQQALKFFVEEYKRNENSAVRTMQVVEIKNTVDKISRIKFLQSKYGILNVFHNSDDKNTPILEEELLRFPVGVHDDIIDAMANVKDIIIPINKTVQREYRKHMERGYSQVMY
jgi:phage terminase large subunit-like protein